MVAIMKDVKKRFVERKGVQSFLRKLKKDNGFSLVELLVVIAIMGVLAAIAFNMFGGVLANSKKSADEQMAVNLEKALLTYCTDSDDWELKNISDDFNGKKTTELIQALMDVINDGVTDRVYGPVLSRKDPDQDKSEPVNVQAYEPQYSKHVGWIVDIFPHLQTVKVVASEDDSLCVVNINTNN